MTGFTEAYRATRVAARRVHSRDRTPVLVHLGRGLGRLVSAAGRARTIVLQLGGLALLDTAAWQYGPVPGCIVAGVALLFLDWMNGPAA